MSEFGNIKHVPTVAELLKHLEKGFHRTNAHELLSDIFECGAIAVSNKFDWTQAKKREQRYINIMKKYDVQMQKLIAEVFAEIYILLTSQLDIGFGDYLGELYMRSETSNSKAGQFFTPYCVSKLSAEVSIHATDIQRYIQCNEILTLNEPACGSGGMIIAAADVLFNEYNFNISHNLFVECSDIDSRCVHMSFLQLGLAGIPAVIYKRNTLTMETWEMWKTPSLIMQWSRFYNFI